MKTKLVLRCDTEHCEQLGATWTIPLNMLEDTLYPGLLLVPQAICSVCGCEPTRRLV